MKRLVLIAMLFFIVNHKLLFALSVETHERLNSGILAQGNGFNFNEYLNKNLGLAGGRLEGINGKSVFQWFRDGGRFEDKPPWTVPYVRSFNHFHNPLEPLADAGYGSGDSAVVWAQKAAGTQSLGGYYSWRDARGYYFAALTATSQTTREENFAKTFRGLGQVMHLVQDMSVPEHARNDGHLLPAYEEWVARKPEGIALTVSALANPVSFDLNALRQPSPFAEAPVPIARLFDSRQYDGSNPEDTTTANIGLAEYTNANFLTGDTLFTSHFSKKFPYPSKQRSVKTEDLDIPDPLNPGTTVKRPYHIKIADGETGSNGQGYRLAGVDFFNFFREQMELESYSEVEIIPPMDDYVFADYAKLLLPRAVGYSATLLHYFFRGQMETTALEKLDDSGNVTELLVNVKNATPNETMRDGYFTLSYRYKPSRSDTYEYRTTASIASGELAPGGSTQLSIPLFALVGPYSRDPSTVFESPIPADATEKQYTLVYSGPLGMESEAVVGKVVDVTPAEIEITHPERFVYAIADDGLTPKSFNTIRTRLRDNAPEIEMTEGSVTARAKFKLNLRHLDNLSTEPPSAEDRSYDFYTSTSLPVEVSLDDLNATEIEFDFSANPIPFGITDLTLEVTYNQGDTAIAFGTKDLNEPQYVGVWNSRDRFLIDLDPNKNDDIHDWRLMTESEIMSDPALVEMLDTDDGGYVDEIIDAVAVNFDVYFSAALPPVLPGTYHATFSSVPAGRYGRFAIIADQPYLYALFHEKYTSSLPDSSAPGDFLDYEGKITYITPGVTNQNKEGTYYYTPIYSFRGIRNHFSYVSAGMYPEPSSLMEKAIALKEANWPTPVDTAPVPATAINP